VGREQKAIKAGQKTLIFIDELLGDKKAGDCKTLKTLSMAKGRGPGKGI